MGLGAFMAGAGTAIHSAQNWQREQEQMQNRAALVDLDRQRMEMQQQAWALQKQADEIKLRAMQQGEADVARGRATQDQIGAPPWPAAAAAGGLPAAGGSPVVVPGGAAGLMNHLAAGRPMPADAPAAPAIAPAAAPPAGGPPAAGAAALANSPLADETEAKRQYEIAVKNKDWQRANAVRDGFVQARRQQVLTGLWSAYSAAKASNNPAALIQLYNTLIPDGRQAKSAGIDPATGKHFIEFSTGEKVPLDLEEMGMAIHRLTNSEEGAKLFGKVVEERVKGDEARKTEGVKTAGQKEVAGINAKSREKVAGISAGASKYAADQGLKGAVARAGAAQYAAEVRGSGKAPDLGKAADKATAHVLKLHNASSLAGIAANAQEGAGAQIERAGALARAGWPPEAAANKALKEWKTAEAAARATKGKPIMPTDVPPPPGGVAASAAAGGVDADFTDNED